ncbi:MAG: glycosyl hydrolase family 28-related protein [Verrucomicrobiota bacterium]
MKYHPRASRVSSLAALFFVALLLAPPASLHAADANSRCEYPAGTILNLCNPPYSADPTGKCDSTEAILRALDDVTRITQLAFRQGLAEVEALPAKGRHYLTGGVENHRADGVVHVSCCARLPYVPALYFPEGTYLVSDTLRYRHKDLQNTYKNELNQWIRIRGAGVGRTVIRLKDGSAGFGKGAQKPVISFMTGEKSNVSMSNYCEDLTIHSGTGNPGAVGLDFFANNSGAVRNVRIVSGDGSGFAGLQLGHANYSGILVKHVEVEGFDHGLHIDSGSFGMFAHAEDIRLRGQRVSGITVGAISLSLRNIQTTDVPVGLTCTSPQGFTVLVDSVLNGRGSTGIDHKAGGLYVSNVTLSGFDDAGKIDERVSPVVFGEKGAMGMARLSVEETPVYQGQGKPSTGVRRFGAIGNGVNDDSPAIQAAMDSGAAEIHFEPGRYLLNQPVVIPATVAVINFNFCDLVAGVDLKNSDREGFLIGGGGGSDAPPLFIERLMAWEQWCGKHCTFTHASERTVCFKDMHTQTLSFYRNTVPGAKVFFDNVATTSGAFPGAAGHGRCPVSLKGQKVWARQLNPERGEPMILNDGGDLVLMGYKSEGEGTVVRTIHGGRTEVMGGVINFGGKENPAFVAEDSRMRISTATHAWLEDYYFRTAISHTQDGKTTVIKAADLPLRGFPKSRGPQYLIPLYK